MGDYTLIFGLLIAGGVLYLMSRTPNIQPTTCPAGQHLVNGVCIPDSTPIICPTGYTLVNGICVQLPSTGISDNFDTSTYILAEGATSPNGLWKGIYVSGGVLQQKKITATDGVMSLEPRAVTAPDQTSAPFILSTRDLINFQLTCRMRTVAQLRTGSPPNTWEVAWILFRYIDINHHYYFTIKTNGLEFGKKDNLPGDNTPEQQIYLATPPSPSAVIGQWYDVTIRAEGFHFQISVNGTKVIDFTDTQVHDIAKMSHGMIGLYSEDSRVEFNDFNVVILP